MFIQWGTKSRQHTLSNVELKVALCPKCKKPTRVNFNYYSEAKEIYWVSGSGTVERASMLCLKCGGEYELEGDVLLAALKLFKEVTEGQKGTPNADWLINKIEREKEYDRQQAEREKEIKKKRAEREKRIKSAKTWKEKITARL